MTFVTKNRSSVGWFLLLGALGATQAWGTTVWSNTLPTTDVDNSAGASRSTVAPVYGSLCDENLSSTNPPSCGTSPVKPYILGDQFTLSAGGDITSVTIYEVGNVVTTVNGTPGDTPDTEFSNLALYIGPDNSPTGLGTAVDTIGGASLLAATTQVCYNGACGAGGTNYQSVDSGNYYAIYAVTFSGLNISLPAGTYDFAVGDTPIGNNTFALLMSDPANTSGGSESSASLSPNGFLYFFADGTGNSPLETYQYASSSGLITNYNNNADVNVNITAVPEPTTFGMIGLGLAAFAFMRRRTRQA